MSEACDEFVSPHRWVMLEMVPAFRSLVPSAPLPWRTGDELDREVELIFDANGRHIATVDEWRSLPDHEAQGIAKMIVIAVNTCGGFRPKLSEGAADDGR